MRIVEQDDIIFRSYVGYGSYKGVDFELSITSHPDGTLTGMPVVTVDPDGEGRQVVFEMGDIIPRAFDLLGVPVQSDETAEDDGSEAR